MCAQIEAPEPCHAFITLFDFIKDPYNEEDEPLVELFAERPEQSNYCSGLTAIVTVKLRVVQWKRGLKSFTLIDKNNPLEE